MFYLRLLFGVLLLLTINSCGPSDGEIELYKIKRTEIHPDIYDSLLDSTKTESFPLLFTLSIQLPIHERKKIWRSLSDSTKSLEQTISLIRCNELESSNQDAFSIVESVYSLYYFYLKQRYGDEMPDDTTLSRINTALFKAKRGLNEYYSKKVIYDCLVKSTFSTRYIFLERGDLRKYFSFFYSEVERLKWTESQDTLTIFGEDTSKYIKRELGFEPIKSGRWISFRDSL